MNPEIADPWQAEIPLGAPVNPAAPCPLRILILEDQPTDAELEQRLLKRTGLDFTVVVAVIEKPFSGAALLARLKEIRL